jgi:hypothetical protein
MANKHLYLWLIILIIAISCEKNDREDPYKKPWNTKYIHYENIPNCSGNHSYGYKLYYKDLLLKEECVQFGGIKIAYCLLVNDSVLHLVFTGSQGSYVSTTNDGGFTWKVYGLGPPDFVKLHLVNEKLSYCITRTYSTYGYLFFTGIGKSNLIAYRDTLTAGTHYITDLGTDVFEIDSTLIEINDTVDYIILFR